MRVFSVGVVGAGQIAQQSHLPVLLSMPNVRVAWIADANHAHAESVAAAFGLRAVRLPGPTTALPPCDAALVAVPVHVRSDYYRTFAERGVPVFAEKPFAVTSAEHRQVLAAFGATPIACGYLKRMYQSTTLLRSAVAEGWFGALRRMRIADGGRTTGTGFDTSFQDLSHRQGGGVLLAIGCHGLDQAFFITGAEGFTVLAQDIVWDGETDRKVDARIRLERVGGRRESSCELDFHVSWLDWQPNRIELEFEHATLAAGIAASSAVTLVRRAGEPGLELTPRPPGATTTFQAFHLEWREFLAGLEHGRPSLLDAATSLATTFAIEHLLGMESMRR